ncbi:ABC transporter ATP-binding protein [Ahrensia marina]|uniref:ABC transporter ATP-binding protein n=1 Tax=Ahrensia marina TaxID=1514904 RepID=A0A0M9GMT6_9HYPH|nr:ABC transporter ATP-binding protein [Ahrensia marina]KPB01443.1 ABC transporter ATP-binding protein [Ahrensia marina]
MTKLLSVKDLHVDFATEDGTVNAVRGINCHINPGECLGVVGESGSGKSQTFLAAMNLLSKNGKARGEINFKGQNLLDLPLKELNKIRGSSISMIFQDPLTSLTPHMRVVDQMREVLKFHQKLSGTEADKKCLEWLERVHIPEAKRRLRQYPFELSGGMRQRVMIAMAMLCNPDLLIADEPTTALDVTIQAEILDIMDELRREQGTAIVMITHDMGVVARMCDRIQVMRHGEYVEEGAVDDIFSNPQTEYTRMLLDAMPRIDAPRDSETKPVKEPAKDHFLNVDNLKVEFNIFNGLFARKSVLKAVDGVSFDLAKGETLGIVGESGSGKSTLARAILRLLSTSEGEVSWLGSDLIGMNADQMKKARQDLQIVFQDPMASLNPSMTIGSSIMEPLRIFAPELSREERRAKVEAIMDRVGLPKSMINRYPHELSGGQNQRVGIARAVIMNPKLVICDEAVSALDVSIQAQIIDLLRELQKDMGLSLIFISHDLSVVRNISDRILVMYLGNVVELATSDALFDNPQHPYTKQLISAVPIPDPEVERTRKRLKLKGELSSPLDSAARLRFMPSKSEVLNNAQKSDYRPRLIDHGDNHFVAEHDPIETLLVNE